MIARLLVITPPSGLVQTTAIEVAQREGVSVAVLLREPGADALDLLAPGGRMGPLLRAAANHDLDVLLSCEAVDAERVAGPAQDAGLRGLQLRADPDDEAIARTKAAWPGGLVGASVHGPPRSCAADYVVFAPVFAPGTPAAFDKPPAGAGALHGWARRHRAVFALGGVEPATAAACVAAGAYGLAGISTFLGPAGRVAETVRALAGALARPRDVPPPQRG